MLATGSKVLGHLVEGFNQASKFIIPHRVDGVTEIAIRHTAGGFSQLLDRKTDRSGHEETKPHGTEQDQQGHNRKQYVIGDLNRLFQQFYLLVFGKTAANKLEIF